MNTKHVVNRACSNSPGAEQRFARGSTFLQGRYLSRSLFFLYHDLCISIFSREFRGCTSAVNSTYLLRHCLKNLVVNNIEISSQPGQRAKCISILMRDTARYHHQSRHYWHSVPMETRCLQCPARVNHMPQRARAVLQSIPRTLTLLVASGHRLFSLPATESLSLHKTDKDRHADFLCSRCRPWQIMSAIPTPSQDSRSKLYINDTVCKICY